MSGQYVNRHPIEISPVSVAELLEGKERVSAVDIHTASVAGPENAITSLSFRGAILDKSALEVLAEKIPEMEALEAVDFSKCVGISDGAAGISNGFKAVLRALGGLEDLQRIHLSGCGLKPSDVSFITTEVATWMKSVVEWDLSENPAIGAAPLLELLETLQDTNIQRINIANCGVSDSRAGAQVLGKLMEFPQLVAVGLGKNSGISVSAQATSELIAELNDFLANNAADYDMDPTKHSSIVAALDKEEKAAKKAAAAPAEGAAAAEGAPKKAAAGSGSTVRRGGSPMKKRADSPSAQAPSAASRPATSSAAASGGVRRGGNSPMRQQTAAPSATTTQRPSTPTRSAVQRASTPTASPRRQQGSPVAQQRQQQRAGSAAPSSRFNSPSRAASQAMQHDVTDGYQHWLENKAKYNDFIHSGVKKKKPEEENAKAKPAFHTYKYAFGVPVDKVRNAGALKVQNTCVVRDPTPLELRTLAPWVTDREYRSTPGRTTLIPDPTNPGGKIKFVDGGELRVVENDPREIGFVARRRESGQLAQTRTGGFASTTPREVRFGTDVSNQVIRWAQAPGPGHYVVKSQFDINREKAQINASNRPAFGSRSERIVFNKKKVDANEADKPVIIYEIP